MKNASESSHAKALEERDVAHVGEQTCSFRADDVAASQAFRRNYDALPNVVAAEDMPHEKFADGLIKHLVHKNLGTKECCVEAYMQFLGRARAPASTGTCGRKSSSSPKGRVTICTGI